MPLSKKIARAKTLAVLFILTFLTTTVFAEGLKSFRLPFPKWWEPVNLSVFKEAYPDVKFISDFDTEKNDWLIHVHVKNSKGKTTETKLYWCDSRFLPEDQLSNKENFRPMLYNYSETPLDPEKFTEKDILRIKEFTTRENRKNSAIDPPFLHNAIFDCADRIHTESHIQKVQLFTLSVNAHEYIAPNLERVHKRVMELPVDEEMEKFFRQLTRTDGFAWRTVRDTQSRSYHSIGLAIDVLPKGYYQRIIYWGWQKQLRPDDWYMTPLSKRWSPPQRVIDIFAEEGFIWGGNWAVWDNMHFEYHPELILYAKKNKR